MMSSTTPPSVSQHSVYCALPGPIRPRSLVRQALTKSAAPGPRTVALPRCDTSKRPTASRTAACSLSTPPPAYSSGISQPPNAANFAPRATWRSCRGERRKVSVITRETTLTVTARSAMAGPIAFGDSRHRRGEHLEPPRDITFALRHRPRRTRRRRDHRRPAQPGRTARGSSARARARRASRSRSTGSLAETLALLGATGAPGEVTKLATLGTVAAPVIAAVGLGPAPGGRCHHHRHAAPGGRIGGARRSPARPRSPWRCPLPDGDDAAATLRARSPRVRCSARTGSPVTRPSHSRAAAIRSRRCRCTCRRHGQGGAGRGRSGRAVVIFAAVARTRDWINTAPNELRPPAFANQVAEAATAAGLEVEVLDEKALARRPATAASSPSAWARRRRPGWSASPTRPRARPGGRPGRQGHHLRHRRVRDQAGAGHVGDEVRHVRRGGGGVAR